MKKTILILFLLLWFTFADGFPSFPMSLYGNIKIWTTPISDWIMKIYDGSNKEIAKYAINQPWKYWAQTATEIALSLNQFSWKITIKVIYKWKTYTVTPNQINDTNKWLWCPNKSSIKFVSKNCRYDIILPKHP